MQLFKPRDESSFKVTYLPEFEGIRGISCLMIIVVHFQGFFIRAPYSLGYALMHLFYMMSSYLIVRNLIAQKSKGQSAKQYFKSFYVKRALRIFPVYFFYIFFVIFIVFGLNKALHGKLHILWVDVKESLPFLFTFTFNLKDTYAFFVSQHYIPSLFFHHLWSVSIEEQFYLIIPFVVYFISLKNLRKLTVFLILLFPLIRVAGFYYFWDNPHLDVFGKEKYDLLMGIMYRSTYFHFDTFMYGIFVLLYSFEKPKYLKWFTIGFILILFLTSLLYGVHLAHIHHENLLKYFQYRGVEIHGMQFNYIDLVLNIICILIMYESLNGTLPKFVTNEFMVETGRISYGLYVYQYLVLMPFIAVNMFLHNKIHQPVISVLIELIFISIILVSLRWLAKLSYYKMELPIINLKNKILK